MQEGLQISMEKDYDLLKLYGIDQPVKQSQDKLIFSLKNTSGNGRVTVYNVFSGISVAYNDMHMEYCNKEQNGNKDILEINHCIEGRYECMMKNGDYYYMSPGDLAIGVDLKQNQSVFPTCHYHGISIFIELNQMSEEYRKVLDFLNIDILKITDLILRQKNHILQIRTNTSIEHIFSELYLLNGEEKSGYLRIKIMELLLFLSNYDEEIVEYDYISNSQVTRMKQIKEYMVNQLPQVETISELAEHFCISQTTLKNDFKKVYGTPIYRFMKQYRLQVAQKLLKTTDMSITDIANRIGYENVGKFIAAFKTEFKRTPLQYRKGVFLDD